MAERLTETGMFIDTPVYKIKNGKKSEAVDKLAQLEDVMEEYGMVDIQDFKDCLESMYDESINAKKLKEFKNIMKKYDIEDLEQLDIMLFCLSSETKFQLKQLQKLYKKYKIKNVEELKKKLANFDNFMKGNKFETIEDLQNALNGKFIEVFDEKKIWQDMVKNLTKTEKDRDTWQKACELTCKHIAEVEWLSCPETDDISESENEIKTLTKQSLNFFYQQAKKEGENETNISGQN